MRRQPWTSTTSGRIQRRAEQWTEPRLGNVARSARNPEAGWSAALARGALQAADERSAEVGLNENITNCFEILPSYLDML